VLAYFLADKVKPRAHLAAGPVSGPLFPQALLVGLVDDGISHVPKKLVVPLLFFPNVVQSVQNANLAITKRQQQYQDRRRRHVK